MGERARPRAAAREACWAFAMVNGGALSIRRRTRGKRSAAMREEGGRRKVGRGASKEGVKGEASGVTVGESTATRS